MVWGVRVLVAWAINVLALLVADWLFDGFSIERWGPVILAGAVLGLANVFLKPLITFIALPLILLTEWVTPDFAIDGVWTYVGATIVIWLVNWIVWTIVESLVDERR